MFQLRVCFFILPETQYEFLPVNPLIVINLENGLRLDDVVGEEPVVDGVPLGLDNPDRNRIIRGKVQLRQIGLGLDIVPYDDNLPKKRKK